jgi:microsomal prostaglandin-E synthase 2
VDGRFVHVLTPNIYRTVSEALQTFDYITERGNFGFLDRELARWSGVAIMVGAAALAVLTACVHTGVSVPL